MPFDFVDVILDVLRNPDAHLQHLTSESPAQIEGFEDIAGNSRAIRWTLQGMDKPPPTFPK